MGHSQSRRDDTVDDYVLSTLGDESSRAIIEALSEPMTANELADACDIPLSTMYRKLERLSEADLVTESTAIRPNGQHTTRYARDFTEITVQLSEENQLQITVDRSGQASTAGKRLEELWAQIREGT